MHVCACRCRWSVWNLVSVVCRRLVMLGFRVFSAASQLMTVSQLCLAVCFAFRREQSIVMSVFVCVCVCLSVNSHILKTTWSVFTRLFVHVASGCGLVLLWQCFDTLCSYALWCGCSVPLIAEWFGLSAVGITQLVAHEAGESILSHEGWRCALSKWLWGGLVSPAIGLVDDVMYCDEYVCLCICLSVCPFI